MSITVHKYTIDIMEKYTQIPMPKNARIINFKSQNWLPYVYIWAIIDTNAPIIEHQFRIATNTHSIPIKETTTYLGMGIDEDKFSYHLFDLGEE